MNVCSATRVKTTELTSGQQWPLEPVALYIRRLRGCRKRVNRRLGHRHAIMGDVLLEWQGS